MKNDSNKVIHTDWFKDAVIYQIYPRSFQDSNGDGIGDIHGIISRLDYLKNLGVTCVWLSPVYQSPMADNGYDISDYLAIHSDYGSMDDLKLFIAELHKRNMKLIMDLVVNHTSDEHTWFRNACSSKDNHYHSFYLWRNKPNNWTGFFGEKAWQYNDATAEYYLHLFAKKQPDLNWDNPEVREEVKRILRFYLDLGVDGFRCDVINLISKDTRFKNGANPLILVGKKYFVNGPHLHEYLHELYTDVFSQYDCMTVGETVFTDLPDVLALTDKEREELSMVFNFDHTNVDNFFGVKWLMRKFSLVRFKKILDKYQYGLMHKGWNSLFYENHDQRRSIGRFGTETSTDKKLSAKMLATALYLLKGTPYVYQGQELGMENWDVDSLDEYKDVEAVNIRKLMQNLHFPKGYREKSIRNGCRDNARTPMQWDASQYAGFSTVEPWLPVNKNKETINALVSITDTDSIYHYYIKLFAVRKEHSVFRDGDYKDLLPKDKKLFCYSRFTADEHVIVCANFSAETRKLRLQPELLEALQKGAVLLNNNGDFDGTKLEGYQAVVVKIK